MDSTIIVLLPKSILQIISVIALILIIWSSICSIKNEKKRKGILERTEILNDEYAKELNKLKGGDI
ncbi:hypothetical protein [Peribacillus loiseleuriae]|uniref:hypothetical protein n=1 Tax=Peribacillus loiseleuriae TaxID=1679170 RepID=UPI003CFF0895